METTLFREPESTAPFYSAASHDNCTACGGSMKRRSPSSTPSLQEPNPKKISLCSDKTLDGFTKVPLPIASPFTWASAPTLRRCISDPVSSPGTNKERGSSSALINYPLSPEAAKIVGGSAWTPSPAKAGSSASVTLPTVPAILRRSFSDPSPNACQSALTPHNSADLHNPKSKRMKRMKDGMTVMRQWLDEVMREGEDEEEEEEGDDGYELDEKNGAPKDHEPETATEEAVSVETSGKVLIIHINCPCGKGFQILIHENNCYYKLL